MQEQLALYDDTFQQILGRKKYNQALLVAICSYLGPSIYQKDTARVACSKRAELITIKEEFLVKKLGLGDAPALDIAIKDVCAELGSSNRNKYRAVFYYLLVEKFKMEDLFLKPSAAPSENSKIHEEAETSKTKTSSTEDKTSDQEEPEILSEDEIKDQEAPTRKIILEHALMAAGAGLVPIPVVDMVTISTVQYQMIKKLAEHYDHLDFAEQKTNSMLTAMFSGFSSMEVGMVSRLLFKGIPIIGPILGGSATSAYAYTATKIVGEVFDEHFAAGGSLVLTDLMRKKLRERLRSAK